LRREAHGDKKNGRCGEAGFKVPLQSKIVARPSCLRPVTGSRPPLMRLCSLSEYCRMRRYHAHWLRDPSSQLRHRSFSAEALRSSRRIPSREILLRPSSHRVTFPYRVSLGMPSWSRQPRIALLGFCPLRRIQQPEPTNPDLPHPVHCAYRLSRPPSALRLWTPPGILQPVTPMGLSLQSFTPRYEPGHPFGAACHLAVSVSPKPGSMASSQQRVRHPL
jgi:hypothetical protein